MSSPFDMNKFMGGATTDAGATSVAPIPAGEYVAIIEDVKPRAWSNEKGSGISLDVIFSIADNDGKIQEAISRPPKLTSGYFTDLTPDGTLDWGKGKNVQLGRLREALGQNKPGVEWTPNSLKGAGPIKLIIIEQPDKNTPDVIYNRVKAVAPM